MWDAFCSSIGLIFAAFSHVRCDSKSLQRNKLHHLLWFDSMQLITLHIVWIFNKIIGKKRAIEIWSQFFFHSSLLQMIMEVWMWSNGFKAQTLCSINATACFTAMRCKNYVICNDWSVKLWSDKNQHQRSCNRVFRLRNSSPVEYFIRQFMEKPLFTKWYNLWYWLKKLERIIFCWPLSFIC